MADQIRSEIIKSNPIGKGLDALRASFSSICKDKSISCGPDALSQLRPGDLQNLTINLIWALQGLLTSRLLPSTGGGRSLFDDLLRLNSAVSSDDFDFDRTKPLLNAALVDSPEDTFLWDQEHRRYMDDVLKEELGPIYVGLRDFHHTYFGDVADLKRTSEAFFKQCIEGSNPLFDDGWIGWPKDANQDDVLNWFADFSERLSTFAEGHKSTRQRRPLAKPNEPIDGSIAIRKMDVGFVDGSNAKKDSRCHWSRILVPGELMSNPYAREVLAAKDTRRFVLGFTICGSLMRIWEFDRLGGIASDQFDINKDGLRFVTTILGFLWMSEEQLGFDPTIMTSGDKRYIDIELDGQTERLIIDKRMKRAPWIAGRATTCWKAHRKGDPQTPLVIKDSWQYVEREEEGELLREATDRGVINVARYYYHETVEVGGTDDDIRSTVRKGLDVMAAENYRAGCSAMSRNISVATAPRKGGSTAGLKRSSSQTDASLPPSKRASSASRTKAASGSVPNRVHRRVVLRDFGQPIYEASSPAALLRGLEGCIEGHESLHKAGFLHRDISTNNLMINEDNNNPSWPSFLIDLDLAIKEQREGVSGAKGKTGTRAFMAIGVLLGEQHSFMHDLESFFWVLFWICVHYKGPGQERVVPRFDKWNTVNDMEELAQIKLGLITSEGFFHRNMTEFFTEYYRPLTPWVSKLRRIVFPGGQNWKREDMGLYFSMKEVLREAGKALSDA
ncbi:hypothetical protein QBC46DRAFT_366821 [Diplogelasinospora grovesii]|uniref:non-specific serine/threonine protein kinase n=1 Tax=Diplogelasinospora grovesii TaxID=303347 RepID=A0AAN6S0E8_9PEZI|nr:hypothetical protein QBC46DRAFT_366821 [Diplogelasinospora grovesii]